MSSRENEMANEDWAVNLANVPVKKFLEFMKYISDNDLWDDVRTYLAAVGYQRIIMSTEPIAAIQEMIRVRASTSKGDLDFEAALGPVLTCSLIKPPPKVPTKPPPK